MNFELIETNDLIKSVLDFNNVKKEELDPKYDFSVDDEVFINFKEKLLENKDLKFLIVGDYDCDGICATTIIKKLFINLAINSNFYIPSRLKDGYGLNKNIVDMAKNNNFDVLFLVDNGIVCKDTIDYAYSLGLKVFIIDHHEYQKLPKAEAIIHSNLVSDKYKDLSAGGLSFIFSRLFYEDDLSIVLGGLSTISDMMKVLGFNRYLIKEMMKLLNNNSIYQMNLLNDLNPFDYNCLSYTVIPKINALSRMEPMGNPNNLVQFFLADKKSCNEFIEKINYINEKRKELTKNMVSKARSLIDDSSNIVVISSDLFEEGLCGLIANRLINEINKPIIVLANKNGILNGSGRSLESLNLYEALKDFKHYEAFGGHEGAIGISLKEEYLEEFKEFSNSITYTSSDEVVSAFKIDESQITLDMFSKIKNLEPFGTGFKKPIIAVQNNDYRKMVLANKYPKYTIRNDLIAISFDPSTVDRRINYFIGYLDKDVYHKDGLEIKIEYIA